MKPSRVPASTYRIQFNARFRFVDCRDLVPFLHEIGAGDVYASPRFRANRGSSHGYDVANPARVNSELGTDDEFDDLCAKLSSYGMGLLLDIVPNHMAATHENPWWMDVLENGPASPYAHYFDIDWHPATSKAAFLQDNKVMLPILGGLYGDVLQNGEFTLRLDESGFYVAYWERKLPLDPASWGPILGCCRARIAQGLGTDHPAVQQMREMAEAVARLPLCTATGPEQVQARLDGSAVVKRRVFAAYRDQLDVRLAIDAALRHLSGEKGQPDSFEALHAILERQCYRLANWKIAFEDINYRRFFDINDLVSLRVEWEDVFTVRHQSILSLVKEGKVTGLRVDHIDGLHDPETYLQRLQLAAKTQPEEPDLYVVVEKVLGRDEPLPEEWRTCGTTGYDFLHALNDLFIHEDGRSRMEEIYSRFTGDPAPFAEVCYARNKQVMRQLFAGEVNALGHDLGKLAAHDRNARDVPLSELMHALVELTACLPVYRTYTRGFEISARDRDYLDRTLSLARRRTPQTVVGDEAFAFLRRVLLLEPPAYAPDERQQYLRFLMRWQQFTGPVMAKGLEDTAFYAHHSLISMNEVGGDPLREAATMDLAAFHRFNRERLGRWPCALNATSTHDTKRGEDARARLNVLTEMPGEWEKRLLRWSRWNAPCKTLVDGQPVPEPPAEILLYQTLIGAWPLYPDEEADFLERLGGFLVKAAREAKTHSSWIHPDEAYEQALVRFARAILRDAKDNRFRSDFLAFQDRIARHGAWNGLSQVLIKVLSPGVPDFYQGSELWNFSLVDPDNRRPVDFRRRVELIEELRKRETEDRAGLLKEMIACWKDGRIKLYLTEKGLNYRRERAARILEADYVAVEAAGIAADNLCAFARTSGAFWCLCAAPLWTSRLVPSGKPPLGETVWKDTALVLPPSAPDRWRNVLTLETITATGAGGAGRTLPLQAVLRRFPVALLEGE